MATLRFSMGSEDSAMNYLMRADYNHPTYSYGPWTAGAGKFGYSSARTHIMSGTVPTQNEFDPAGSTFRSGEILITLGSRGITWDEATLTGTFPFSEATATATGTATWFYMVAYHSGVYPMFAGTISGIGGGGDLEMTSTSIVSGEVYQTGELAITVPHEFTY